MISDGIKAGRRHSRNSLIDQFIFIKKILSWLLKVGPFLRQIRRDEQKYK